MGASLAAVERFVSRWTAHDLEGTLACCAPGCAFESTGPAPDGARHLGIDALRAVWRPIFEDATSRFTVEESIESGDRVVQRWRYDWGSGHVRGVDLFTVRDGLVTEKLSYVKG